VPQFDEKSQTEEDEILTLEEFYGESKPGDSLVKAAAPPNPVQEDPLSNTIIPLDVFFDKKNDKAFDDAMSFQADQAYDKNLEEQFKKAEETAKTRKSVASFPFSVPDAAKMIADAITSKGKNLTKARLPDSWRDWATTKTPFASGVQELTWAGHTWNSLKKIQDGTAEEIDYNTVYDFTQQTKKEESAGFIKNLFEGISSLPAFMTEIGMTGGASTVSKKAMKEGLEKLAKGGIKSVLKAATKTAAKEADEAIKKLATGGLKPLLKETAKGLGKAAVQGTKALPLTSMPESALAGEMATEIGSDPVAASQKELRSVAELLPGALVKSWSEVTSEMTGAALAPWVGATGNVLKRMLPKRITKGLAFLAKKMKISDDTIEAALKSGKWDGPAAEIGEERINEMLQGILLNATEEVTGIEQTGKDFGIIGGVARANVAAIKGDIPTMQEEMAKTGEQFALEVGILSAPGLGGAIAQQGLKSVAISAQKAKTKSFLEKWAEAVDDNKIELEGPSELMAELAYKKEITRKEFEAVVQSGGELQTNNKQRVAFARKIRKKLEDRGDIERVEEKKEITPKEEIPASETVKEKTPEEAAEQTVKEKTPEEAAEQLRRLDEKGHIAIRERSRLEPLAGDLYEPPKKEIKARKETYSDVKQKLEKARNRGDMTMQEVDQGTDKYRGKGGISSEAKTSGFQAAFRDNETNEVAIPMTDIGKGQTVPSGVHIFDGLPDNFVTEKNNYGEPIAVKGSVEAGFVRDGKFYTREEASAALSKKPEEVAERDTPEFAGEAETPKFKKWFKESKAIDAEGKPEVMYHGGSFSAEYDKILATKGTLGVHFGTRNAALDRIGGKPVDDLIKEVRVEETDDGRFTFDIPSLNLEPDETQVYDTKEEALEEGRTFAHQEAQDMNFDDMDAEGMTDVYLSIQNPLRLTDLGSWDFGDVVKEVANVLETDEITQLSEIGRADEAKGWDNLKELLKGKGYDGIVYRNNVEDKGKDSWIAFDSEQVKSASINTGEYDPGNADIASSVQAPKPSGVAAKSKKGLPKARTKKAADSPKTPAKKSLAATEKERARQTKRRATKRAAKKEAKAKVEESAVKATQAAIQPPGAPEGKADRPMKKAAKDLVTDLAKSKADRPMKKAAKDLVTDLAKSGVTKMADIADHMAEKVGEENWEKMRESVVEAYVKANYEHADYSLEGAGPRGAHTPWYASETPWNRLEVPEMIQLGEELGAEIIAKDMRPRLLGQFNGSITQIAISRALDNVNKLSSTLAHEIGHLFDYLDDKTMARGNILGRLRSVHNYLMGEDGFAEEVRDELIELSRWWRGDWESGTSYGRYREHSKELYADAISVLLNTPDQLKERAPEFYKEFFTHLENKPSVLKELLEIQYMIMGDVESVAENRSNRTQKMFKRGYKAWNHARNSTRVHKQSALHSVQDRFAEYILDRGFSAKRQLGERADDPNLKDEDNAFYAIDELQHVDNRGRRFMEDLQEKVFNSLDNLNVSRGLFAEYLFMHRIASGGTFKNEKQLFNPEGHTEKTAADQKRAIRKRLGDEKYIKMVQLAGTFHDIIWEIVEEAAEAGTYSAEKVESMRKDKDNYVTFAVLDYLNGESISAALHERVGTFKDIMNVLDATIMKMFTLTRWSEKNKLLDKIITQMEGDKNLNADVHKAKVPKGMHEMPRRARKDFGWFYAYRDGQLEAWEIPKEVADGFSKLDLKTVSYLARLYSSATYGLWHPLFVTLSLGFNVANPFRDLTRAANNLAAELTWKQLLPGTALPKVAFNFARALPSAILDEMGVSTKGWEDALKQNLSGLSMKDVAIAYAKSFTAAYMKSSGFDQANIDRMRDDKALSISYAKVDAELSEEKDQYKKLMEQLGLEPSAGRTPWGKAISIKDKGMKPFAVITGAIDTASKIGGERILREAGVKKHRKAYIVRKAIGTPDYRQEGQLTHITNALFMYSRVNWVGKQHDAAYAIGARGGGKAMRWWFSFMTGTLLPYIAAKEMLDRVMDLWTGDDDDEEKKRLKNFSDYMQRSYLMIPTGYGKDADNVLALKGISIPRGDFQRFLISMWHYAGKAVEEEGGLENEYADASDIRKAVLGDIGNEILPGLTPPLKLIAGWWNHSSGRSPYNNVFSQNVYEDYMSPEQKQEKMNDWYASQFGILGQFGTWMYDFDKNTSNFKISEFPGVSRLYRERKVSDMRSASRYLQKEIEEREVKAFNYTLPEAATKLSSEFTINTKTMSSNNLQEEARRKLLHQWSELHFKPAKNTIRDARAVIENSKDVSEIANAKLAEKAAMKTLKDVSQALRDRQNAALMPLEDLPPILKPVFYKYLTALAEAMDMTTPVRKTKDGVFTETNEEYQTRYLARIEKTLPNLDIGIEYSRIIGRDAADKKEKRKDLKKKEGILKKRLGKD